MMLLNDALKSADAGYVADALGIIVRKRGLLAGAGDAGVSAAELYKGLNKEETRPVGGPHLAEALRHGIGCKGAAGVLMHRPGGRTVLLVVIFGLVALIASMLGLLK